MKKKTALLIAAILATAISSWAKVATTRQIYLSQAISLDGAQVPSGIYKLSLESQGPSVRATFWQGDRFIATARGIWVKQGVKYTEDAVLLRVNADGTRSLSEIRLAGTSKSIVLDRGSTLLRVPPVISGAERNPSNVADNAL